MSATISTTRAPYPLDRLGDGQPRAMLFDAAKCIGCRQCVEACKDWNDLPRGNAYAIGATTWLTIEPPVLEGQATVWGRHSCQHCEYPVCAAVCPVEAITKYAEGAVVIDAAKCIGCEYCIYACPWDAIAKDPTSGKATKCTLCVDRLTSGNQPFCVQACPVDALDFGSLTDMAERSARRRGAVGGTIYGWREAGGTHVLHVLTRAAAAHGLPTVGPERFPWKHIPWSTKLQGVLTLTGGLAGKWRAVQNALQRPDRLKYRYWHRAVHR